MSPKVTVLDYGSGNLRSAQRALEAAGADVVVTADLAAAERADGLVVPGVGAFAACMAGIEAAQAGPVIADRVMAGRPVLGICVGAQIMFDSGDEHGVVTKGLGLLPGAVTRLAARRVPHMGWNLLDAPAGSTLFTGVEADARCYFVHSYAAPPNAELDAVALVTTSTHERATFVAAAERGPLAVAQFHPEKSGAVGARVLRNWIATL
ncbi:MULTISPECIES: imidazole glycerol phosphate synthase subunit HisH [Catellatospora]|uniref:Imidazole glycerol phosphate synthase subunit HisH n=2 Tax=Catellatospora TaxID=53365 RepID=A0A8J3K6W9_9ACTN|nr:MULTISPECIES: imidazole glycerol phosphate synthase subunit HisH [Catellatospora]RKE07082.1 imidazole glycerol phosphate synthase subunit HisH [Catellatospora citrea]GIF86864.1 imidazole glycerol phosphate synthase subunit HisH [Catellatospora chokoriensis]GIF95234.1 imidazole glycerol phosphate synthase subunit HisH [Catellatospora citrea]